MSATTPIAFVVLFAAFGALVAVARRPRPFPDGHPRCRRCRYDLTGLLPGDGSSSPAPRCPECGTDLAPARNVVRGRPRRTLAAAVFCVLITALVATQWDESREIVSLRWRLNARFGPRVEAYYYAHRSVAGLLADGGGRALAELSRRARGKLLGNDDYAAVVAASLRADPFVPVSGYAYHQILATARAAGKVSDADWLRHVTARLRTTLDVRPQVRPGDPLPLTVSYVYVGGGVGDAVLTPAAVTVRLDVDGPPHPLVGLSADPTSGSSVRPLPPEWFRGVSPGDHAVVVDLDVVVCDPLPGSGTFSQPGAGRIVGHVRQRLTANTRVLPPGEPAVKLVTPTTGPAVRFTATYAPASAPGMVWVYLNGRDPSPVAFCYRVAARVGGRELPLGVITPPGAFWLSPAPVSATRLSMAFELTLPSGSSADAMTALVLRPDPEAAARTLDVTAIDGREVTVPVSPPATEPAP